MHKLTLDPSNALVIVELSGFCSLQDARQAGVDVRAAIRSLGAPPGSHLTIYDMTDAQVAPGETIDMLGQLFKEPAYRHLQARKVAFVTRSALGRLQLARV